MCQRYFELVGNPGTGKNTRVIGAVPGDGGGAASLPFVVTKRATPTITNVNFQYYNGSAWVDPTQGFSAEGTYSADALILSDASNRLTRGQFAASSEL